MLDFLGVTATSSPANALEVLPRTSALPLVTAGQAPRAADGTNAITELLSAGFQPLNTVLVGNGDMETLKNIRKTSAQISMRSMSPERIEFSISSPAPTIAVIAQTWMPGWRATVGGADAAIIRANHAFMAVAIPVGESVVELRYWDTRWLAGILTSAVTLVGSVVFLVRTRR
jgi:uncharacterized membrane protein YfhO